MKTSAASFVLKIDKKISAASFVPNIDIKTSAARFVLEIDMKYMLKPYIIGCTGTWKWLPRYEAVQGQTVQLWMLSSKVCFVIVLRMDTMVKMALKKTAYTTSLGGC